jgi:hypothetical protein
MAIEGKLNSGTLATGQNKFGSSLAATADGNTLVAGMPQPVLYFNQQPPASNGAVFEFKRNSSTWGSWAGANVSGNVTLIQGPNTHSYEHFNYGHSVAVNSNGTAIAVGERYATVSNVKFSGQVHVYSNQYANCNTITLTTPAKNDRFGSALAMNGAGDIMIATAPGVKYNSLANVGEAYLYFKMSNGWTQQTQVFHANTDRAANIYFGNTVAMSNDGSIVVIGAPGIDSKNNQNIGGAYIYSYETKNQFTGSITNTTMTVTAVTSNTSSISVGQYVVGTNVSLGTKVANQVNSSEDPANVILSGYTGSNTVTLSVATNIGIGYTANCTGVIPNSTVVTAVLGNTVSLSQALTNSAIGQTVTFTGGANSIVSNPISSNANANTFTLTVGDYSNITVGQFVEVDGNNLGTVTGVTYHAVTLSGNLTNVNANATYASFRQAGRKGVYALSVDNSNNVSNGANNLSSYNWKSYSTKISAPEEIPEGKFGQSVAVSNSGNVIVVGSSNGAFVFDSNGGLTARLNSVNQRPGDSFGRQVAVSGDGNTIVVAAPNRSVKIVDAIEVYTDGRSDFVYEIVDKGDADWANLGVMTSNVTIANITQEGNIDVMYVTKSVSYGNSNLNAGISRIPVGSYVTIANVAATVKIVSQLSSQDANGKATKLPTAPSNSAPWRFGVEVTYSGNIYANASGKVGTVASVYSADGNISNANITTGTRFIAIDKANAKIGNGTALSYNLTGTPNAGAVYTFVNTGNAWEQKRTLVVNSDNTEWNKLGQVLEMSADGNTVFASSTGVEQFGRTNEGMIYVFNIK